MEERGRIDSWFIGFAPVENPKIAWVVVVECGGYGARTLAPIAGNLLAKAKGLGLLSEEAAQPKPSPATENARTRR